MPLQDIVTITGAIGHHDEATGTAVDVVSAAVILADKTDCAATGCATPLSPASTPTTGSIRGSLRHAEVNTGWVIQMDLELTTP